MMRYCNNRRGFTVVEVLSTSVAVALIAVGLAAMVKTTIYKAELDMAQVTADSNAAIAMGQMVGEIREAKGVTIVDPGPASGSRLLITMPVTYTDSNNNPYYDRNKADTVNQISYYLSDKTGVLGKPGTYLWRVQNSTPRCIRKDVSSLLFEEDSDLNNQIDNAIMITVVTTDPSIGGQGQTRLTDRVVYLRNYSKIQ